MSEGFYIADVTLAVIFALLLLADFAVIVKLKTYQSFSPGFVSIGLILFVLTRLIQLCYMCSHTKDNTKVDVMDVSRLGRTLHSISFYLFSIVSFNSLETCAGSSSTVKM